MKQERKLPTITVRDGDQHRRLKAIENEFSAECLVRFQMRGRRSVSRNYTFSYDRPSVLDYF